MPDTPVDAGHVEWLAYRYRELTDDDLFWFTRDVSRENKAYRKVNDKEALDLSIMKSFSVDPNRTVYQKEY